jgi:pyruvate/2-oxoglutarate dehydrogenase complex dihydrolipoamide dehydrogenase (E3) component
VPRTIALPPTLDRPVYQAWDVLRDPALVPPGRHATIIGGGMVGIETADVLILRGCRVTVIEATGAVAREMARNNRFDVLQRVRDGGGEILTDALVEGYADGRFTLTRGGDVTCGDVVVLAIGPVPDRAVVPIVEAAGVPYVLAGDCNVPGDFMTAISDASLVGLAL